MALKEAGLVMLSGSEGHLHAYPNSKAPQEISQIPACRPVISVEGDHFRDVISSIGFHKGTCSSYRGSKKERGAKLDDVLVRSTQR